MPLGFKQRFFLSVSQFVFGKSFYGLSGNEASPAFASNDDSGGERHGSDRSRSRFRYTDSDLCARRLPSRRPE